MRVCGGEERGEREGWVREEGEDRDMRERRGSHRGGRGARSSREEGRGNKRRRTCLLEFLMKVRGCTLHVSLLHVLAEITHPQLCRLDVGEITGDDGSQDGDLVREESWQERIQRGETERKKMSLLIKARRRRVVPCTAFCMFLQRWRILSFGLPSKNVLAWR